MAIVGAGGVLVFQNIEARSDNLRDDVWSRNIICTTAMSRLSEGQFASNDLSSFINSHVVNAGKVVLCAR